MSFLCFVDLEITIVRVARKVLEWVLSKKEILDVLSISVMSLYESGNTRIMVILSLS